MTVRSFEQAVEPRVLLMAGCKVMQLGIYADI